MTIDKNSDTPDFNDGLIDEGAASTAEIHESPERVGGVEEVPTGAEIQEHAAHVSGKITQVALQPSEEPDKINDVEGFLKKALIYIVDDVAPVRRAIEREFRSAGCGNIKSFEDGEDVLAAIFSPEGSLHELPAVIVTDTEMERIGGLAMFKRIVESGIAADRILVVAMSGDHNKKDQWGGVPFVEKPFNRGQMVDTVKKELIRFLSETRN